MAHQMLQCTHESTRQVERSHDFPGYKELLTLTKCLSIDYVSERMLNLRGETRIVQAGYLDVSACTKYGLQVE